MKPADAAALLGIVAAIRSAVDPAATPDIRDRALGRARAQIGAMQTRYPSHARVVRIGATLLERAVALQKLTGDRRDRAEEGLERAANAAALEARSSIAVTPQP